MPRTEVYFYREEDGRVPVEQWLRELRRGAPHAYGKCRYAIRRLEELGHELRRPVADYLRDGIYELRVRAGRVNYRILYFFHGRNVALLAHGLMKEGKVPVADIDRAVERSRRFLKEPHTHLAEFDDERESGEETGDGE